MTAAEPMGDDDAHRPGLRQPHTPVENRWKIGTIAGCDPRTAQRRLMEALLKTAAMLNERKRAG